MAAIIEGDTPGAITEGDAAIYALLPKYIYIKFKQKRNGSWVLKHKIRVDLADPLEDIRVAIKYLRKGIGFFSSRN